VIPLLLPQRDKYDIVKDILEKVYDAKPLYRNQMNQTHLGWCKPDSSANRQVSSRTSWVGAFGSDGFQTVSF